MRVLDAVGEITGSYRLRFESFPWFANTISRTANMPRDGLDILKPFDAITLARWIPDRTRPNYFAWPAPTDLPGFEQYVCYRPSQLLPVFPAPLACKQWATLIRCDSRKHRRGVCRRGWACSPGLPIEVAVETSVFSRVGVERVIRYAFKLAQSRPRKRLVSATKSNAQQHSLTFWMYL